MLLAGHADAVLSLRFSPDGAVLGSASADRQIYLWRVYGDCENHMALTGHKNAVLELHWLADGDSLVSASADRTVRLFDAVAGEEVARFTQHTAIVNACCPVRRGPPLVASGSDSGVVHLWDTRARRAARTFEGRAPVTAVAFSDAGDQVFAGGVDNVIKVWDLRADSVAFIMEGHSDSITGLALNPAGTHLLSNAMDNTLRSWDVRAYVAGEERCMHAFTGHSSGFEKSLLRCAWSPDGKRVSAGSSDRMVYVWDVASGDVVYALPGHHGAVTEAVFHPYEPILGSCSADKTIYLGELV